VRKKSVNIETLLKKHALQRGAVVERINIPAKTFARLLSSIVGISLEDAFTSIENSTVLTVRNGVRYIHVESSSTAPVDDINIFMGMLYGQLTQFSCRKAELLPILIERVTEREDSRLESRTFA